MLENSGKWTYSLQMTRQTPPSVQIHHTGHDHWVLSIQDTSGTVFLLDTQALVSYIYVCLLSTSIHKERSLSVSRQLPQFTVEKNVLEFLNDLKFILYLKYDNFSTTCCMTRLPLLPIIYVKTHYIIQLEIHKNTSYFSGNTDAAVNRMERSDWSIEISKNKLGIFGCIYNGNL
jgi:hypothetical protein